MKEIGNKILLTQGEYVNCGGKYYKYIGRFESIDEVPKTDCLYVIGCDLFKRSFIPGGGDKKRATKKKEDTSDKLNFPINSSDNELMIIIKELLKNYTKNDFNRMFTNETEKNNMKRVLETTNDLSWKRFIMMLELMNLSHTLTVEKEDNG